MWASLPGGLGGLNTSSMPTPGWDAYAVSSHESGDFHLATGGYPNRPPPLTFIRPPAYTFAVLDRIPCSGLRKCLTSGRVTRCQPLGDWDVKISACELQEPGFFR